MRLKGKASVSALPVEGDTMPSSLKSAASCLGSYASACAALRRSSSRRAVGMVLSVCARARRGERGVR